MASGRVAGSPLQGCTAGDRCWQDTRLNGLLWLWSQKEAAASKTPKKNTTKEQKIVIQKKKKEEKIKSNLEREKHCTRRFCRHRPFHPFIFFLSKVPFPI